MTDILCLPPPWKTLLVWLTPGQKTIITLTTHEVHPSTPPAVDDANDDFLLDDDFLLGNDFLSVPPAPLENSAHAATAASTSICTATQKERAL